MIATIGLLHAALIIPVLACLLCLLLPRHQGQRALRLLPWVPLPLLLLAVVGDPPVMLHWDAMLFGAELGVDAMRRPFALLAGLLWSLAGVYAIAYLREDDHAKRFALFWLLTFVGTSVLILAHDVASFYSGFAVMTFSGYGLVVHNGSREARHAGRIYLIMAVIGEGLIIAGLILASSVSHSLMLSDFPAGIAASDSRHLITGILLCGFGIKAGLALLHFWLPLAHPVAPTPASAVLSGVMIKAGLLGWLLVLPFAHEEMAAWGPVLFVLGLLGALGGGVLGICQQQAKAVLAYSSISQMGLMVMFLSAAMADPSLALALLPLVTMFALHHGLAKGALFLAVGQLPASPRWWHALLLIWPGLALIGLPLSSGASAKLMLKDALKNSDALSQWLPYLLQSLSMAAFATSLLMLHFFRLIWHSGKPDQPPHRGTQSAWIASVIVVAVTPLLFAPLLTYWVNPGLTLADCVDLLLPFFAALAAVYLWQRLRLSRVSLPAGDLLAVWQRLGHHLSQQSLAVLPLLVGGYQQSQRLGRFLVIKAQRQQQHLNRIELVLRREVVALLIMVLLVFTGLLFLP